MYTKFITLFLDDFEDEEKGFFNAVRYLNEYGILEDVRKVQLQENLSWIESHFKKHPEFSFPESENEINVAMSWIKGDAIEHLNRMTQLKEILEENDILVEVLEVDKPGKIIYEDEFQVVAIPFADDY